MVEVAEFKRNEFEVEEKIHELKPGAHLLKADVKATNFTGTPVSGGKVNWSLREYSLQLLSCRIQGLPFRGLPG